jgi:hypothetical protein
LRELLKHAREALVGRRAEQPAHERRRHRRHHLPHDLGRHPGPGGGLLGHLPAYLGAEQLADDPVALAPRLRRERLGRLVEEGRVLARAHHPEEVGEAHGVGGVALEAEREGRHQGLEGAPGLVDAEAELPGHVLHGRAALRRAHQVKKVEHAISSAASPVPCQAQGVKSKEKTLSGGTALLLSRADSGERRP